MITDQAHTQPANHTNPLITKITVQTTALDTVPLVQYHSCQNKHANDWSPMNIPPTIQQNTRHRQQPSRPAMSQPATNREYKHSDLTGRIIGCAMKVHSELGNGFQEVIYQRALAIELASENISFSREHEMPVYYKGQQIGTRRVDFLVEGVVSVELKAIIQLEDVHLAQAINYLEAYDLEVGLLINFGARSLQFKRVTNRKFRRPRRQPTPSELRSP